jgi:large subunit ribosomal protein L5
MDQKFENVKSVELLINMKLRLLEKYLDDVVPNVQDQFKIKNKLSVPRIDKVVINMGVGEALNDIHFLENAMKELGLITGQKPLIRRSRKAISNFKLRENVPVGCKVTLRKGKMYEFLDRLMNIALPRIRDFNGVSRKSFDKDGNCTLGITDQSIFPEIPLDTIHHVQGMDVSIVFNHGPKDQTFEVLRLLGMPFRKN